MRKFVINLRRRPDRLEKFLLRCPLKEIEVIEAFDGKNFTLENKKEQRLFNNKLQAFKRPGERGVFISHLRIWKKIVNENIPYGAIFEDDAQFNENFLEVFEKIETVENILFLGGRFQDNFIMPGNVLNGIVKHNYQTWEAHSHDRTAHAYIITYQMAKFLIELFNITDITLNFALDAFIVKKLKVLDIPVYSTVPLICWSPLVGDSDIR